MRLRKGKLNIYTYRKKKLGKSECNNKNKGMKCCTLHLYNLKMREQQAWWWCMTNNHSIIFFSPDLQSTPDFHCSPMTQTQRPSPSTLHLIHSPQLNTTSSSMDITSTRTTTAMQGIGANTRSSPTPAGELCLSARWHHWSRIKPLKPFRNAFISGPTGDQLPTSVVCVKSVKLCIKFYSSTGLYFLIHVKCMFSCLDIPDDAHAAQFELVGGLEVDEVCVSGGSIFCCIQSTGK